MALTRHSPFNEDDSLSATKIGVDQKNRDGGEDGIRTHDTLLTYTPLAGERLRPLGHLSVAPLDKEKHRHNQQAGGIIAENSPVSWNAGDLVRRFHGDSLAGR